MSRTITITVTRSTAHRCPGCTKTVTPGASSARGTSVRGSRTWHTRCLEAAEAESIEGRCEDARRNMRAAAKMARQVGVSEAAIAGLAQGVIDNRAVNNTPLTDDEIRAAWVQEG